MREGDLDSDGVLSEMEFCVLMFRLSPQLMKDSWFWLQQALQHELINNNVSSVWSTLVFFLSAANVSIFFLNGKNWTYHFFLLLPNQLYNSIWCTLVFVVGLEMTPLWTFEGMSCSCLFQTFSCFKYKSSFCHCSITSPFHIWNWIFEKHSYTCIITLHRSYWKTGKWISSSSFLLISIYLYIFSSEKGELGN